jgi:hypothetical protein
MSRVFFILLLVLSACARPLSDNEAAFAGALFGESLDRGAVTVRAGVGLTPLPAPKPDVAVGAPPPPAPKGVCERVERTAKARRWPAAFVLWSDIFWSYDFYTDDAFRGWPDAVPFQSLIMAHELVHVWQWQNRDRTGYNPARSARESIDEVDPYFWLDGQAEDGFFSYGYERQAAMIEDYVCFQLFEPEAPEVDELEAILAPVLPLEAFRRWLDG